MPGILRLRKIQFGRETVAGTKVNPANIWRGMGVLNDERTVVFPDEHVGLLSPTTRNYIPAKSASLSLDEVEATFEQLPIILSAAVSNVVSGVADGGGSGKIYTYTWPTTASGTVQTYSVEAGDNQQAEFGQYGFVEELTLSGRAGEAVKVSSTWRLRSADNNGYTASTIGFVATGKKIQDSANGLGVFLPGQKIVVSGTVSNNGTFTISTVAAGEIVVLENLVNEAAGSAFTLEQTFTAVSLPTVEDVIFQTGKLYIDEAAGTIGATLKSNTFIAMSLTYTTGWVAVPTGDGNLYFSFIKNIGPQATLTITFEHDGTATTEKSAWRNKLTRQVRMLFEGSALTTAGTYSKKSLVVDMVGRWESFSALEESDGNDTVTGTLRGGYDSTAALFGRFVVVNQTASIA